MREAGLRSPGPLHPPIMKTAILTHHAQMRTSQRCSLSPDALKRLLDGGASVTVATQEGGRHMLRLLYSRPDTAWFIAVQDGKDAAVLTLMPLEYVEDRLPITADQKRTARKQARNLDTPKRSSQPPLSLRVEPQSDCTGAIALPFSQAPKSPSPPRDGSWWICIRYAHAERSNVKTLGRTPPEFGHPSDWAALLPIHAWFREQLSKAATRLVSVVLSMPHHIPEHSRPHTPRSPRDQSYRLDTAQAATSRAGLFTDRFDSLGEGKTEEGM
jgi:hypothetical protein